MASSSNSTVPSPPITKCAMRTCNLVPTIFCENCQKQYCDSHKNRCEDYDDIHEHLQFDAYQKLTRNLHCYTNDQDVLENWTRHIAVHVKRQSDNRVVMSQAFSSLANVDRKEDLSIVSFIGPTGVGKSWLMRCLFQLYNNVSGHDLPIPSEPGATQSQSSDIFFYPSPAPVQSETGLVRFLYFDSEGFGGSTRPKNIGKRIWNLLSNFTNPDENPDEREMKVYFDKRVDHVNKTYPRLLYLFSDTVCFVFQGSMKEVDPLDKLLSWGRTAASSTANLPTRPKLILIYNKMSSAEFEQNSNTEVATRKFFEVPDPRKDELRTLYSSAQVICIPDASALQVKAVMKLNELHQAITSASFVVMREKVKSQLVFRREEFLKYFEKAVSKFNRNKDEPFSLFDIALEDRPIGSNVADFLNEFFRITYEHTKTMVKPWLPSRANLIRDNRAAAYEHAVLVLIERIRHLPLLYLKRARAMGVKTGTNATLPASWVGHLSAVQQYIDNLCPCLAIMKFSGKEEVETHCETMKLNHIGNDMHSSSATYTVPASAWYSRIFGQTEKIPCNWKGEFENAFKIPSLIEAATRQLRGLSEWSPERVYRDHIVSLRSPILGPRDRTFLIKDLRTYNLCLACLMHIPTERLSCNHICCYECLNERSGDPVCTCPVCGKVVEWIPSKLRSGTGFRMLSLDGGGVRVIVELLILLEVEKRLPGMELRNFFDFIIGTSGGGIIATALTVNDLSTGRPKSLSEVLSLIKNLSREVFEEGQRFLTKVGLAPAAIYWYKSKYSSKPLYRLMEKTLADTKLYFGTDPSPKVAVTTCEMVPGSTKLKSRLFTSYNRDVKGPNSLSSSHYSTSLSSSPTSSSPPSSGRSSPAASASVASSASAASSASSAPAPVATGGPSSIVSPSASRSPTSPVSDDDPRFPNQEQFRAIDAVMSSTAAGTYFPPYKVNGIVTTDGGMMHNCPVNIGLEEIEVLFPSAPCDIILSLGAGAVDQSAGTNSTVRDDPLQFIGIVVDLVTNAELCWRNVRPLLNHKGWSSRSFRINPVLPKYVDLDDWKSIDYLTKIANNYIAQEAHTLELVAHRLFASLFYHEIHFDVNNIVIQTRTPLSPQLSTVLRRSSSTCQPFQLTLDDTVRWNYSSPNGVELDSEGRFTRFIMTVEFASFRLQRDTKIDIRLNCNLNSSASWCDESISGCPTVKI